MAKLVKLFLLFGPVGGNIKVIKKYGNPGQNIDESLLSTLCLPRIQISDQPSAPKFQTFLVTREDGEIFYGSGLIVYERHHEHYSSHCYTLITNSPFINATRSLLHLIRARQCDDILMRAIMNIPLPARRRCLRIVPPMDRRNIDDIYLYRGMTELPLLDYPLRELLSSSIQIDDFLLAFACILMEYRTLIISQDNYRLMMFGETLTSLLCPLKWCNVYVPILPPIYGATYLDAPTSYIMGLNTQVTELPDNLNHVQCRIYCDESRVICDVDSLTLPLFLNDLKKDILAIIDNYKVTHATKPFTYLDDLKFNRAIRVLFIKTIRKNILANYERYIVDVPESSSEIRQFDVVSYLSDQPEFMYSFLNKFLETQLFASFIDENAKRMQQSWLSIFDIDPEELSEHFTDKALEQAFATAQRIHLMDLRDEKLDIEVKTVPASPMKLRRRPGLSSLANRLTKWSTNSTSVDHGPPANLPTITASPIHRNSIATASLQNHHPLAHKRIAELLEGVKSLSKGILLESMGAVEPNTTKHMGENSTLIGALCDLIEKVWSHGAFFSPQEPACCPLWNHLIAFTRLKYLDSKQEFADGSNLNVLSPALKSDLFGSFNWFKSNRFEKIGPLDRDLINDLRTIHLLKDVKTDVGKARAFIRLSLERKKLSKHLKTLLRDQALLNSLYKPYAFLRSEEEREQFLMYLLTLNAVDLPCFTSTFVSLINTRLVRKTTLNK